MNINFSFFLKLLLSISLLFSEINTFAGPPYGPFSGSSGRLDWSSQEFRSPEQNCAEFYDHVDGLSAGHSATMATLHLRANYPDTLESTLNGISHLVAGCTVEFSWYGTPGYSFGLSIDTCKGWYANEPNGGSYHDSCIQTLQKPKNMGYPQCGGAGNPINPATGNKYQRETDYGENSISSESLTFIRHYNSQLDENNIIGKNWRTNYDRSLTIRTMKQGANSNPQYPVATAVVTVHRPDGKKYDFMEKIMFL